MNEKNGIRIICLGISFLFFLVSAIAVEVNIYLGIVSFVLFVGWIIAIVQLRVMQWKEFRKKR